MAGRFCFAVLFFAALLVAGAGGQSTSDCTTAYTSITPCLTYVSGTDSTPSASCCTGLKLLNTNNPVCLCQIVGQLENGTATGVNVTKVYALPSACGVTVNTANCPALALPPSPNPSPSPSPSPSIAPTPPTSFPPPGAPGASATPPGPPPGSPASVTRPTPWMAVLGALAALGVSAFFAEAWVGASTGF